MSRFLPSLSVLRAFEAAARHMNFTRAAEELSITQTAVSHHVKSLEKQLGVRLFVRHRNTLRLTEPARKYLASIQAAVEILSDATAGLVQREQDMVLTINTLATFAMKCLVPRLSGFRERHPEIVLRIIASSSFHEFNQKPHDVAVRWGDGVWPGMRVDKLFAEALFPVCSPALLRGPLPLREPRDLPRHTIIRNGFSFLVRDDWPLWLHSVGMSESDLPAGLIFEYALPAMEAAAEGLGVALGRTPFVDHDLRSGRLVRPFDIPVASGAGYYLVCARETANRPKIKAFREWLLKTLEEEGGNQAAA